MSGLTAVTLVLVAVALGISLWVWIGVRRQHGQIVQAAAKTTVALDRLAAVCSRASSPTEPAADQGRKTT